MCWAQGTKVLLENNIYKNIEDINPGDMVWTPNGYQKVRYLIKINFSFNEDSIHPMCHYDNKLWITPWHPIRINNNWHHPNNFKPSENIFIQVVYNMMLRDVHIIEVNGIQSSTLGHGLKGSIIEHSFFGNQDKIIDSINKQDGFSNGKPIFKNLGIIKNSESNEVIGWFDNI
jgi:hypothetical protein